MTLDQATEDLLVVYSARGRRPIHLSTPESARAAGAQGWLPLGTGTAMCSVREHVVGSIGGEFRVRVLRPAARTSAVVVYLHGGGWLLGDIDGYDALGRILAARSGATVVLANYRKAPEHPFPLPVEDAWAALRWAGEHRASLTGEDVGPVPLIVARDSAWGSLAAVTALRAREAGGPRISQQPLIDPITDCDRDRPSYLDPGQPAAAQRRHDGLVLRPLRGRGGPHPPGGQPAARPGPPRAADTTLVLAGHDPLHDEGLTYADRLRAAGSASTCGPIPTRCTASSQWSPCCPPAQMLWTSSPGPHPRRAHVGA